jgi:hypothetical protein
MSVRHADLQGDAGVLEHQSVALGQGLYQADHTELFHTLDEVTAHGGHGLGRAARELKLATSGTIALYQVGQIGHRLTPRRRAGKT